MVLNKKQRGPLDREDTAEQLATLSEAERLNKELREIEGSSPEAIARRDEITRRLYALYGINSEDGRL
jgi:hypothetical protein